MHPFYTDSLINEGHFFTAVRLGAYVLLLFLFFVKPDTMMLAVSTMALAHISSPKLGRTRVDPIRQRVRKAAVLLLSSARTQ